MEKLSMRRGFPFLITLLALAGCGDPVSIKTGPQGTEINVPGVHIKAGPEGANVQAPGVNVNAGPQRANVQAPGVNLNAGPGGVQIGLGGSDPPTEPIREEWKPLARLIGTWQSEITIRPSKSHKEESHTTSHATFQWFLNGGFVTAGITKDAATGQERDSFTLFGYDADAKQYRGWRYYSDGSFDESIGAWDEKSQTLTFTPTNTSADSRIITIQFHDDKSLTLHRVDKDADGALALDLELKLSRK
jgi:hypothetical protein